jgi:hypothetical protein
MTNLIKSTNIFFQGDLGFMKLPNDFEIPKGFIKVEPESKGLVLAYGEVSGHAHAIRETQDAVVFYNPATQKQNVGYDEMYIFCKKPCLLVHEEHTPIMLQVGWTKKWNQKEYTFEEEYRVVAD